MCIRDRFSRSQLQTVLKAARCASDVVLTFDNDAPGRKFTKDLGEIDVYKRQDREGRCMVLPAKPDQTIYQWRKGDDCPSVSRLDGVQINADGEITYPIWCGHLTPGDFGKTVFLTREEAALRREQDG